MSRRVKDLKDVLSKKSLKKLPKDKKIENLTQEETEKLKNAFKKIEKGEKQVEARKVENAFRELIGKSFDPSKKSAEGLKELMEKKGSERKEEESFKEIKEEGGKPWYADLPAWKKAEGGKKAGETGKGAEGMHRKMLIRKEEINDVAREIVKERMRKDGEMPSKEELIDRIMRMKPKEGTKIKGEKENLKTQYGFGEETVKKRIDEVYESLKRKEPSIIPREYREKADKEVKENIRKGMEKKQEEKVEKVRNMIEYVENATKKVNNQYPFGGLNPSEKEVIQEQASKDMHFINNDISKLKRKFEKGKLDAEEALEKAKEYKEKTDNVLDTWGYKN